MSSARAAVLGASALACVLVVGCSSPQVVRVTPLPPPKPDAAQFQPRSDFARKLTARKAAVSGNRLDAVMPADFGSVSATSTAVSEWTPAGRSFDFLDWSDQWEHSSMWVSTNGVDWHVAIPERGVYSTNILIQDDRPGGAAFIKVQP